MIKKKHIDQFNENGYVIIKKLVKKKEIEKVFSQMNETIENILEYNNIKFSKKLSLDQKYFLLKKKKPKLKSHFYDSIRILDSFNNIIYSNKIVKVIKKLLNAKTLFITNHRLRTDHKNEKANLSLHQELNNISTESALIFCPFVKVNKKTGSICVIPKSHKFGHIEFNNSKIPAEDYINGKVEKILKNKEKNNYKNKLIENFFTKKNIFFPSLNPGDTLIFKSMLFHGSTNYQDKGIRWTLLGNYHLVNKTPYILKDNFKAGGMELGIPMRIPYKENLNKILKKSMK